MTTYHTPPRTTNLFNPVFILSVNHNFFWSVGLLLPPVRLASPTLDAKARTSGDISQLPLFLPQLDPLGCIPARSLSSTVLLISGDICPNMPSLMFRPSLSLSCPSLSPTSLQTAFLPISMSSTAFPMFGLTKPPPADRVATLGSLGTFARKLFLDGGILVQNISLKFCITPLL